MWSPVKARILLCKGELGGLPMEKTVGFQGILQWEYLKTDLPPYF
jgi:hypothetical protein